MSVTEPILFLAMILCTVSLNGCCPESEIPSAIKGLYSAEARERNRSLQVLAQCSSKADIESSVPRIAALMYDKNVGVASSAAYALRRIDTKDAREALKLAEEAKARRAHGANSSGR